MTTYSAHGVRFQFPSDWGVQEQSQENELLITVSSQETSFWSLGLFFELPSPEHVVQTVLRALEDDYPEIDIYESQSVVLDQKGVSCDVEFVCMELINSAWIRAFQTPRFTALVMYQSTDYELESALPILEAITNSLECNFDVVDDEMRFLPSEPEDDSGDDHGHDHDCSCGEHHH
ncbi:MAG: hypothetical protein KDA36_03380 [Planctomycetaceae bacterium]|nr:hypothetical protein [Planctomycetaceae bacterium]